MGSYHNTRFATRISRLLRSLLFVVDGVRNLNSVSVPTQAKYMIIKFQELGRGGRGGGGDFIQAERFARIFQVIMLNNLEKHV